jgi:hypothetical protein
LGADAFCPAGETRRFFWPFDSIIQTALEPPCDAEYAIYRPSGDHAGVSFLPPSVSRVNPSPSGVIVNICNPPALLPTKAIRSPRGDHAGDVL